MEQASHLFVNSIYEQPPTNSEKNVDSIRRWWILGFNVWVLLLSARSVTSVANFHMDQEGDEDQRRPASANETPSRDSDVPLTLRPEAMMLQAIRRALAESVALNPCLPLLSVGLPREVYGVCSSDPDLYGSFILLAQLERTSFV